MKDLIALQTSIHEQNVQMGWWDNPRCFSTTTNLGVSENSEAMEGDRKGLMDDHLTLYPMSVVEIGDMCIRTLDLLGHERNEIFTDILPSYRPNNFQFNLASATYELSSAWYWYEIRGCKESALISLRGALALGIQMIRDMGYDPEKIINEKVEYNKHRADHKRENRALEGGKKY